MQDKCQAEIQNGKRFAFGRNWRHFLSIVDENKIQYAMDSLRKMLGCENLLNKKFLDVGCGSGLFSLAARKLGAQVYSFDYDEQSIACAFELKKRYFAEDDGWVIHQGSVLDQNYLKNLGKFDVVYSWGVLHHTGNLLQALENVLITLKEEGVLYIAIYNDQGWVSKYWQYAKRKYCESVFWRAFFFTVHLPYTLGARALKRVLNGQIFKMERGMSVYYDYMDWMGGYPFEVASAEKIEKFYCQRNCKLIRSNLTAKSGCSEFVFCLSS